MNGALTKSLRSEFGMKCSRGTPAEPVFARCQPEREMLTLVASAVVPKQSILYLGGANGASLALCTPSQRGAWANHRWREGTFPAGLSLCSLCSPSCCRAHAKSNGAPVGENPHSTALRAMIGSVRPATFRAPFGSAPETENTDGAMQRRPCPTGFGK